MTRGDLALPDGAQRRDGLPAHVHDVRAAAREGTPTSAPMGLGMLPSIRGGTRRCAGSGIGTEAIRACV